MKQRYTALLSGLGLLLTTDALAVVTITDNDGNVVNELSLTTYGSSTAFELAMHFTATLDGSSPKTVNVKRYELNTLPGTTNYFCWELCYAPRNSGDYPEWVGVDFVDLEPGIPFEGFGAYIRPLGVMGVASFRYVWYNVADPNDSTWMDINFESGQTGVAENLGSASFNLFPDPAIGQDITLDYAFNSTAQGRTLEVFDMLGSTVLTRTLGAPEGRLTLPAAALKAGVYFATVRENDRAVLSRRFTVASR